MTRAQANRSKASEAVEVVVLLCIVSSKRPREKRFAAVPGKAAHYNHIEPTIQRLCRRGQGSHQRAKLPWANARRSRSVARQRNFGFLLLAKKLRGQLEEFAQQRSSVLIRAKKTIQNRVRRLGVSLMGPGRQEFHHNRY